MVSERDMNKVTERFRRVFLHAQDEAYRRQHDYIGTEHLLLGLLTATEGCSVLASLGADANKIREAVGVVLWEGNKPDMALKLTPRARRVVELAHMEADVTRSEYTGSDHLLMGLLIEGNGVAAGVLNALGVTVDKVRGNLPNLYRRG